MQNFASGLTRSTSIKALIIGALVLILLIPVAMIEGVVYDRIDVHNAARNDIMQAWGGSQLLTGPVLVLPYRVTHINSYGNHIVEKRNAFILPEELAIDVRVDPEIRYRGMHKVPIYSAHTNISGSFAAPDFNRLEPAATDVEWEKAYVALIVSDPKTIAHTPDIEVSGAVVRFESGGDPIFPNGARPIIARIQGDLAKYRNGESLTFKTELQVNGADSLRFSALGDTSHLAMTSNWASPSFIGGYLPEQREIRDDGFSAEWRISGLGRSLPSQWTGSLDANTQIYNSSFGVTFYQPIGLYQMTLRAATYAVLFIGMTFAAYFLFETMTGLRLHPLQYLLVGFANALFYLLLLSLSEHLGFGLSYLLSAIGSIGLIAGYSNSVLGKRSRGGMMAGVLAILYGFLYLMLNEEKYALLSGALGLWVALAIIMYLTRRVDWYRQGADKPPVS